MKTVLLSAVFALFGMVDVAPAFATELNLACVIQNSQSPSGFDVREVIVGDQSETVQLKRSSKRNASTIRAMNYAVVMTLIPGEGGKAARYEFYTLQEKEFSLVQLSAETFRFTDLLNHFTAECELNREVHANPALTISN